MRIQILDENGNVINTILADEATAEARYPGRWRLEEEPQPEPVVLPRHVTPLAFLGLFSIQERIAIRRAADQQDESGVKTDLAYVMQDFLDGVQKAQFINLDDPRIAESLQMLVGFGLLSADRVIEILTHDIQDSERP